MYAKFEIWKPQGKRVALTLYVDLSKLSFFFKDGGPEKRERWPLPDWHVSTKYEMVDDSEEIDANEMKYKITWKI